MKKKVFICIFVVALAAVLVVVCLEVVRMHGIKKESAEKTVIDLSTEEEVETEPSAGMQPESDTPREKVELPRMVMVDGMLYKDTGITSHVPRCGVMDGEISSTVKVGEKPVEDNQSNFGNGYGYQRGVAEGRIEVYMDEKWQVFSKEEVDWGITLTTQNETATGATIVCMQEGGNFTGALQTEGYYIIETLQEGVWVEAPCIAEVAWDSEAWIISPDSTVSWDVEWKWLYRELEPGIYRIGKRIVDFRGTGNYDSKMFYAEFAIVDEI